MFRSDVAIHSLSTSAATAAACSAGNMAARPSVTTQLGRRLRDMFDVVSTWGERARERRQLLSLDDHALRDIGLTRAEAEDEWRKPFWRV